MYERAFALFLAWRGGIISAEEYNEYLDALFLEDMENELLLDLEIASYDFEETKALLIDYVYYTGHSINYTAFGKALFGVVEKAYRSNAVEIEEFGRRAYSVWRLLSEDIWYDEPFLTLNYADDCLSYGDEAQTRGLYETAFAYDWDA